MRELVRQWFDKAEQDFGLALHLIEEQSPYTEAISFHSQQAAEKFLKAYLVWRQIEFPKTHDLDKLLDLIATRDPELAGSMRELSRLTNYSVDVRYPGEAPAPDLAEAKAAVELAAQARATVSRALKSFLNQTDC
jgi:HEPN domain-containing protein